jgi:hypothetical protein
VVKELLAKGRSFDEQDKVRLAERERALLEQVIPAYRAAAERGQVEISTSPYYHPILPLLCDTRAHHEAPPGAPLPRRYCHPEDAADQIRRALDRHESLFGRRPPGVWPSEGSVSEAAVLELARAGVRWTASDESVLERSVERPLHRDSRGTAYPLELVYRPWVRRTAAGDITLLFRDRALSDLIGFSYAGVDPAHAASTSWTACACGERWRHAGLEGDPLVGVMLDGENAWENFRDGGATFLGQVYTGMPVRSGLQAVTIGEGLAATAPREIPRVFAGSWIHADFSVWIGHADDRRAWELLATRGTRWRGPSKATTLGPDALERAREMLQICLRQRLVLVVRRRPLVGERPRVRPAVPAPPAGRVRGPRPARRRALDDTLITTRHLGVRQSRPRAPWTRSWTASSPRPRKWVAPACTGRPSRGAMHHASQRLAHCASAWGRSALTCWWRRVRMADLLSHGGRRFELSGPRRPCAIVSAGQTPAPSRSPARPERDGLGPVARPPRRPRGIGAGGRRCRSPSCSAGREARWSSGPRAPGTARSWSATPRPTPSAVVPEEVTRD